MNDKLKHFIAGFTICIVGYFLISIVISALGADGFTLTWTRTGATASATATVYYLALR